MDEDLSDPAASLLSHRRRSGRGERGGRDGAAPDLVQGVPGAGHPASRARLIADAFAQRFPPALPPPGSDAVPAPGRYVRCSAETPGQLYVAGETYARDARARITARSGGMPAGWSIRLTVIEAQIVACRPTNPGSRADPTVLRLQRQMADPTAAAQLAAPLRQAFPGRPIHNETHSLFVPTGMAFLREASAVIALPDDPSGDGAVLRDLVATATALLGAGAAPAAATAAGAWGQPSPARPRPVPPPSLPGGDPNPGSRSPTPARRGHLRLIQ